MAVLQIYPQCLDPCIALIPRFDIPQDYFFFLLESAARLVLVIRHFSHDNPTKGYGPRRFALFEILEVFVQETQSPRLRSSVSNLKRFELLEIRVPFTENNCPSLALAYLEIFEEVVQEKEIPRLRSSGSGSKLHTR
ncbi:unnamed protein product [Miscanthus lutarioriparius]|uniref:Uncharacterized protein n=1 Tax=Miscanthus lutarioriparius TaxID=422564 RepID=A0A811QFX5_9POAL|nr:unnamed protein product [Miscanthus lutarioriparius]